MAQAVSSSDDRIVIAVDFGTTFSGVAYAFNSPGKKPEVVSILDWPGELLPFPLPSLTYLAATHQQIYGLHVSCHGLPFQRRLSHRPRLIFTNRFLALWQVSMAFASPRCQL